MNDSNLGGFTSIGTPHRYLIDLSSITEENKKCNHESRIFTSILVIFQTCEKRVLSINAKFRFFVFWTITKYSKDVAFSISEFKFLKN